MAKLSADGTPWTDAKRLSYLCSVRGKLQGFPLLLAALEKGTLADPYAIPHTLRRCLTDLNAVIASFSERTE